VNQAPGGQQANDMEDRRDDIEGENPTPSVLLSSEE